MPKNQTPKTAQAGVTDTAVAAPVVVMDTPVAMSGAVEPGVPVVTGEPEPPIHTHNIRAVPRRGFYRAGRHWPSCGIDVSRADFTDEQWAALEGEAKLAITTL